MAKFCGKCGGKLDDVTGKCPNCDKAIPSTPVQPQTNNNQQNSTENNDKTTTPKKKQTRKEIRAAKKAEKKANMTIGQKIKRFFIKLIVIVLCAALLVVGILTVLVRFNKINIPLISDILYTLELKTSEEDYKVDEPNADEFFKNNADIITEKDVNKSTYTMTESEVSIDLESRGFTQYPITTEYTMDGTYSEAYEISNTSTVKHPIYQTYYICENSSVWTIFMIDNKIMANPVSYNSQSQKGVQVILSESNTVTSYDSSTNKFYETIPSQEALIVITVTNINAATLETITAEDINNYE